MVADVRQPVGSAGRAKTVTGFLCANCSRPGKAPDSGGLPRPTLPRFDWPLPVREVLVPCTGRLQPEHVLKAVESGTDLVFVVSCDEGNCQYLEGSERWARRADYLQALLDEIGLGGDRLLHFHLSGTAAQDCALGAGRQAPVCEPADMRIAAIRDEVLQAVERVTLNPLSAEPLDEATVEPYQQDISDDDNED